MPLRNPPTVNRAMAGQSIPVTFKLGGYKGMKIFEAGYPKVQQMNCSTKELMGDPMATTSIAPLHYIPYMKAYTYVWKTQKSFAGKCYVFNLKLVDGTLHQAYVKFK